MSSFTDAIEAISQRLDMFFATRTREADPLGPEASAFVAQTIGAVHGGKRLRALFCTTGWRAIAEVDGTAEHVPEPLVAAAAALEIFHAAALVHDDLIDNSDTRRGRPSAHRALEAHHRTQAWSGDAAAFGRGSAILAGDLLVAWSDDLFEDGLRLADPRIAASARTEYARMRRDVTVGQFLDIAEESAFVSAPDADQAERALRVASLKSARYSVEQPLVIGAALAGADPAQQQALRDFGHPVGMAFQLRDDVLGVFGDERVTGKPSGDDLREGKRTVLIAYAREALPAAGRAILDRRLGDPTLDGAQISALQEMIVSSGALDRVEELIAEYSRRADSALSGAPLGERATAELRELARAATARSA